MTLTDEERLETIFLAYEAKLALHDMLLAYLIQSADAMNSTALALASDPLLNDSLDSAKILLNKVFYQPIL
jgi:hypothetical protein